MTLPFQAGGVERDATGPFTFVAATGWTVTLTTASIALGPFYFNNASPRSDTYRSGVVVIEVTEQVVIDALNPSLIDVPGGADGESESAVAVEIELLAPDATQSVANRALLEGNVGIVEGTAVKNGVTVPFRGPIVISPSLATPAKPLPWFQRVNGADVALTFSAAPQTLSLRVDPSHWFDQADFSQLAAGAAGTSLSAGVYSWNTSSTFLNQLLQGVTSTTGVYLFTLN